MHAAHMLLPSCGLVNAVHCQHIVIYTHAMHLRYVRHVTIPMPSHNTTTAGGIEVQGSWQPFSALCSCDEQIISCGHALCSHTLKT